MININFIRGVDDDIVVMEKNIHLKKSRHILKHLGLNNHHV